MKGACDYDDDSIITLNVNERKLSASLCDKTTTKLRVLSAAYDYKAEHSMTHHSSTTKRA